MTKKAMELVNPSTEEMECGVCGSRDLDNIKPGETWQCRCGCKIFSIEVKESEYKPRYVKIRIEESEHKPKTVVIHKE